MHNSIFDFEPQLAPIESGTEPSIRKLIESYYSPYFDNYKEMAEKYLEEVSCLISNRAKKNRGLLLATEIHRQFDKLETGVSLNFNLIEDIWYEKEGSIYWNTDGNKDDLLECTGNTYNLDYYEETDLSNEDHLHVCGDVGYGDQEYYVFLKENEIEAPDDCEE